MAKCELNKLREMLTEANIPYEDKKKPISETTINAESAYWLYGEATN